tara:strand:- start:377 stop:1468 length:1092 start_codon:yes stop_codon:yes gene_type:complete
VYADQFANTLFCEALTRTRGAVIDVEERIPPWEMGDPFPDLDRRLYRWDPWVRTYLVAQELVSRVRFRLHPNVPGHVTAQFLDDGLEDFVDGVTLVRPPTNVFASQISLVLSYAELREERTSEILAQIEQHHAFWNALVPIQADRLRHTRELLDAAVQFAIYIEMKFKHELACWRPCDYSAQVQPMLTTPGHGSLPSGHCTQAYVVAEVLKALLNTMKTGTGYRTFNAQLHRLAARIATNRVIAGVHFPVDNVAGRLLGTVLGEYFCFVCGGRGPDSEPSSGVPAWRAGRFDGTRFPEDTDFDPFAQPLSPPVSASGKDHYYEFGRPKDNDGHDFQPKARSALMNALWVQALEECRGLGLVYA